MEYPTLQVFPFSALWIYHACLFWHKNLLQKKKKMLIILSEFPCIWMTLFISCQFGDPLFIFGHFNYDMFWYESFWIHLVWDSLLFFYLYNFSFFSFGKFSVIILSNIFSTPSLLSYSSGTPIMRGWYAWWCIRYPLKCFNFLNLVFFLLFWLGDFHYSIFQITYAFFRVSPSLSLVPSSVFFISVIVFFSSGWCFFIFSTSLIKFSLCSPILFLNSASIFINNTLNSSSGKFFISVSLVVFSRGFLLLF